MTFFPPYPTQWKVPLGIFIFPGCFVNWVICAVAPAPLLALVVMQEHLNPAAVLQELLLEMATGRSKLGHSGFCGDEQGEGESFSICAKSPAVPAQLPARWPCVVQGSPGENWGEWMLRLWALINAHPWLWHMQGLVQGWASLITDWEWAPRTFPGGARQVNPPREGWKGRWDWAGKGKDGF